MNENVHVLVRHRPFIAKVQNPMACQSVQAGEAGTNVNSRL